MIYYTFNWYFPSSNVSSYRRRSICKIETNFSRTLQLVALGHKWVNLNSEINFLIQKRNTSGCGMLWGYPKFMVFGFPWSCCCSVCGVFFWVTIKYVVSNHLHQKEIILSASVFPDTIATTMLFIKREIKYTNLTDATVEKHIEIGYDMKLFRKGQVSWISEVDERSGRLSSIFAVSSANSECKLIARLLI